MLYTIYAPPLKVQHNKTIPLKAYSNVHKKAKKFSDHNLNMHPEETNYKT